MSMALFTTNIHFIVFVLFVERVLFGPFAIYRGEDFENIFIFMLVQLYGTFIDSGLLEFIEMSPYVCVYFFKGIFTHMTPFYLLLKVMAIRLFLPHPVQAAV